MELQTPKGRKRKYAEYDELLNSIKGQTLNRPRYIRGIGIRAGERGITAWLKIRLPHGAVYQCKSYKAGSYLEIKAGKLVSFTWEQLEDLFRLYPVITLSRAWDGLRDKTGIKDIRIHDLRATCATYAASAGVPPKTLAALMGWSSLKMLEKYYVGVVESDTVQATVKIENAYQTSQEGQVTSTTFLTMMYN